MFVFGHTRSRQTLITSPVDDDIKHLEGIHENTRLETLAFGSRNSFLLHRLSRSEKTSEQFIIIIIIIRIIIIIAIIIPQYVPIIYMDSLYNGTVGFGRYI